MAQIRPIPDSYYYSGQGRLFIGERDASTGKPLNLIAVGNVPALEVQLAVTTVNHRESMSGDRATDLTLVTEKTPTVVITFESLSFNNLVAAFWGEQSAVSSGTVAASDGEVVKIKRGGVYTTEHPGISDLSITVGGTALAEDGNYDYDPAFGTIYVKADAPDIPAGGEVEATLAYSYTSHERLDALTQTAPPERFLRFEGLNTINGDSVLVEIPRAAFQPLSSFPLINEEVGQVEVTADILLDPFITTGSRYLRERLIKSSSTGNVVVTSLTVAPSSVAVNEGGTQQLVVSANLSDGSTQVVTSQASYQSSDAAVATVSAGGLVTGVAAGDAVVTATYQGVSTTVAVEVSA